MKRIRQPWQHLAERVDAMSLRERALIFAAAALVLVTLVNSLLIDPLLARQRVLSLGIVQTQGKTATLQTRIQAMAAAQKDDPNAALHTRLARLQQELASADASLHDFRSGLVSPRQMPAMLEDILQRNGALRLVSLKALPTQNLADTDAAAQGGSEALPPQSAQQAAVYRHGVEITVQGSYADLLRYLTAMEASPYRMFWGKVDLRVDAYPKATLTLTLYTLSLDEAWLTI